MVNWYVIINQTTIRILEHRFCLLELRKCVAEREDRDELGLKLFSLYDQGRRWRLSANGDGRCPYHRTESKAEITAAVDRERAIAAVSWEGSRRMDGGVVLSTAGACCRATTWKQCHYSSDSSSGGESEHMRVKVRNFRGRVLWVCVVKEEDDSKDDALLETKVTTAERVEGAKKPCQWRWWRRGGGNCCQWRFRMRRWWGDDGPLVAVVRQIEQNDDDNWEQWEERGDGELLGNDR